MKPKFFSDSDLYVILSEKTPWINSPCKKKRVDSKITCFRVQNRSQPKLFLFTTEIRSIYLSSLKPGTKNLKKK